MATISEAFALAMEHHRAGRFAAAEQIYRQILQLEPNHADALHLLGVIAHQAGQHATALEYIGRAIAINPQGLAYYGNLATVYRALGRPDEAIASCRRALTMDPDHAGILVNLGDALQERKSLAEATACYRRALEINPHSPDAHNNLGKALHEQGQVAEAIACFRQALEERPNSAAAYNNLGIALHGQGRLAEAVLAYQQALELDPHLAAAHNNLGNARKEQGQVEEAAACYQRALALQPDYAEAHNNLGNVWKDLGRLDEAVAACRRSLELKSDNAEAHNNLGNALKEQGKILEAMACYQRALQLTPNFAEVHNNLGNAWRGRGDLDQAAACYRHALSLKSDYPEAHNNLGTALHEQGQLEEAVACYRRALELKPDFATALNNLGGALKDQGLLDEAVVACRQAIQQKPDYAVGHSNLVYTLHFLPDQDAQSIYDEHRRWNRQQAQPLAPQIQPHANDRSPGRRLRIGYVSPDFRWHPVGRFLLPLLEAHDRASVELFCYASLLLPDSITARCRDQADTWREVIGLSDEQLAESVRRDRIDILVDLTMHMAHNRLLVFARKPAPVQVTYLAYCGTTGLGSMDYRLTDPYLDRPGEEQPFYSEQSIWLPETYWCYRAEEEAPPVTALPALSAGQVTFGCLNNFCKVTAPALAAWGRLLQALPGSRLLLHAHPGGHRDRARQSLARQGVAPERLTFVGLVPPAEYFRIYDQIDVALDPFPYSGGTTTCDALWMGVPVVSLAGKTAVGRGGLSILSNVGLPELVARDDEQYLRIAMELAGDLARLSGLRETLRGRMQRSPLMDAPRFARNVEAAYRTMWQRWCGG